MGHIWKRSISTWLKTILGLVSLLTGGNWVFRMSQLSTQFAITRALT